MIRFAEILEQDPSLELRWKIGVGEPGLGTKRALREAGRMDKEILAKAKVYYQKLLTLAQQIQSWVENDQTIDISLIEKVVRSTIEHNLIDPLYHYLTFNGDAGRRLAAHSVAVTIVSLKVAKGMNYDNKRLATLALIAFAQDVGMYKIPRDILEKRGMLSKHELKEIKSHPNISADILSGLGDDYAWLADVARQIHERADGSGYPLGIKDEGIYEYAYIVGLADVYSAMIEERPYRERIEPNLAVRNILDSSTGWFPRKIVKVFLNQITFFPLNSRVKLNDRSVGRVIDTNPDFPLKPRVEILYDSLGTKLQESRVVDISEQILLYVTRSVDEKDIV